MILYAPDYYSKFRCIAEKCRHSCCIGWEIDIDPETAEYYKNVSGKFGEKLRSNIDFLPEGGTFRLCKNGRCPFLNEKNLCEIYINLGEEAFCNICDDHPRFRNFYESRTEIGLGMCCEEASRIIIEKREKTALVPLEGKASDKVFPEEEEFFALREKAFSIVQNREKSIGERAAELLGFFGLGLPEKSLADWAEIYLGLERLDEEWTEVLQKIKNEPSVPEIKDEIAAEQILCYYIFRHFGNLYPEEACAFAVLSLFMIEKAAEQTGIIEAARLYSSEIEYSDENTEKIIDAINKWVG
ncbi:MAG: flagellin lysine-N-methylase [Oscillospiraceae bacterium]|nr:flagellin lysine-N-methylase [Oscillospiraceae bacterium]